MEGGDVDVGFRMGARVRRIVFVDSAFSTGMGGRVPGLVWG